MHQSLKIIARRSNTAQHVSASCPSSSGPTTTNDTATTTFQRLTKQYLLAISKPEAATAVYKLLMMGKRMPETC
jgi:hypothetical protein